MSDSAKTVKSRRWSLAALVAGFALVAVFLGYLVLSSNTKGRSEGKTQREVSRSGDDSSTTPLGNRVGTSAPRKVDGTEWRKTQEPTPGFSEQSASEQEDESPTQLRVFGQVRHLVSDEPVPFVDVVFADALGESTATSNKKGEYELSLRPGGYRVHAQGESVAAMEESLLLKEALRYDVLVNSFATIEGKVVHRDGSPAPGALVVSIARQGRGSTQRWIERGHAESDEDGSFLLQSFEGDLRLLAYKHAEGEGDFAGEVTIGVLGSGKNKDKVRIKLVPSGVISGQVLDPDGAAVKNARVLISVEYLGRGDFDRRPHLSDEEGRFHWQLPQFGTVIVEADSLGHGASQAQSFVLGAGESREGLELRLRKAEFSLSGRVVDEDGRALANVEIAQGVEGSKSRYRKTHTDSQGRFSIDKLSAGPHRLRARLLGYKQTRAHALIAPKEGIEIVMPRE